MLLLLSLLSLLLVGVAHAACTGSTVFCTLIRDAAPCADAKCEWTSSCLEPTTAAPLCVDISAEATCLAARCVWKAPPAPLTDASGQTVKAAPSTTRRSSTDDNGVPQTSSDQAAAAIIMGAVVGATMLVMIIAMVLVVCLRTRRYSSRSLM